MERPEPSWQPQEPQGQYRRERLKEELAASMDDETIFGPVVWKLPLSSAVQRGLLARYQIIVVELTDPEVTPERLASPERLGEKVRGQRLGALQAAMLRTMAEHNLQTMITFHHRTVEAQAYAATEQRSGSGSSCRTRRPGAPGSLPSSWSSSPNSASTGGSQAVGGLRASGLVPGAAAREWRAAP